MVLPLVPGFGFTIPRYALTTVSRLSIQSSVPQVKTYTAMWGVFRIKTIMRNSGTKFGRSSTSSTVKSYAD